jgi:plastocyanin
MTETEDTKLHDADGIDRRGFLKCMAWAGAGLFCTFRGGVLSTAAFGDVLRRPEAYASGDLHFVQISDSHIGFSKEANKDVTATLKEAVARINALPTAPAFLIHTGDISHLSKPEEFDTVDQVLKETKASQTFFVPGEHDILTDNGKGYLTRYGKGTRGNGWYSFDHSGVHFVGLVNVFDLKAGGMGALGPEQLAWLEKDLAPLSSSTPVVVFAHIPLWTVYPEWGWGTEDSARALSYLKRFGSVTVLNGHIHQTMQKVEGNVTFHTATSTAFPQPRPGTAPSPGPMKVPPERLRDLLGITSVAYVENRHTLAVVDSTLSGVAPAKADAAPAVSAVTVDNFRFSPPALTVPVGTTVVWTNQDDVPHTVVSSENRFASAALDTGDKFSFRFKEAGAYPYYCSVHPMMTGKVIVH